MGSTLKPNAQMTKKNIFSNAFGTCGLTNLEWYVIHCPIRHRNAYFVSARFTTTIVKNATSKNIRRQRENIESNTTFQQIQHWPSGPGIRRTQVKSSSNKNRISPSRSLNEPYFSEMPLSWHVQ